MRRDRPCARGFVGRGMLWLALAGSVAAAPTTIYETGFEPPAFLAGYLLDAQDGWYCAPTNAAQTSLVVSNELAGLGQQALIGLWPPEDPRVDSVSIYRFLDYEPLAQGRPLVAFRVTMAIVTSERPERDFFRWSVYNRRNGGERLFSLDFDHLTEEIWRLDDDTNFTFTGYTFVPDNPYDLVVIMNFADNVWSATLNDALIVNAAPLTARALQRDLGDIDAVWVRGAADGEFGDHYMLFDDFRVVADVAAPLPCQVELAQFLENGDLLLRLTGEPGRTYALDATDDWVTWFALGTNTPTSGGALFIDPGATGRSMQFYRGRAVWP